MLNVVEVGAEIKIDDSRLALHDGLSHSVHRLMRCPFRSVSIRPRWEFGLEDRLQDELDCPLNHAIADRRNRKNSDSLAPVLGNFLLPRQHGPIRVVISSSLICLRKPSTPLSSMVSNVTPSIPGAPSFSFAIRYASCRVSILQTWTYNPQ